MFQLDAPLSPAIKKFIDSGASNDEETGQKTSLNAVVMHTHRIGSIETLIQELEPYLTDDCNDFARARATLLIAEVLTRLPDLPLSGNRIQVLNNFFCARLDDPPSIPASFQALLALQKHHSTEIPDSENMELVIRISDTLHVPQLNQPMRKRYYELVYLVIQQERMQKALSRSQQAQVFIRSFLNAMTGEKDPRNLKHCFQIAQTMMQKLEMVFQEAELSEQYFRVISCYFPITFTPPPNDPYGVTTEELIRSLRNVLTASDVLIHQMVPFLLEKLSGSMSEEAKVDALDTLGHCVETFSLKNLLLHIRSIGQVFYHEILNGERARVIETASNVLSRVSSVIGRAKVQGSSGSGFAWNAVVVTITNQAVEKLHENSVDSMSSASAGKVLASMSRESLVVSTHVLNTSMPLLIEQVKHSFEASSSQCEAALDRLMLFVDTIDEEVEQISTIHPIHSHASPILEALVKFLEEDTPTSTPNAKRLSIRIISHLVIYPSTPVVRPSDVERIVRLFTRGFLSDASKHVRSEFLSSLKALSGAIKTPSTLQSVHCKREKTLQLYGTLLKEHCIAQLLALVQDGKSPEAETFQKSSCRTRKDFEQDTLAAITELSHDPVIFKEAVVHLLQSCFIDQDGLLIFRSFEVEHTLQFFQAVATIIELNASNASNMEFCASIDDQNGIAFKLLDAFVSMAMSNGQSKEQKFLPPNAIAFSTRILRTIMQNICFDTQQKLLDRAISRFHPILQTEESTPSQHLYQIVSAFSTVINSANRSLAFPKAYCVIDSLMAVSRSITTESHGYTNEIVLLISQSIGSILNKVRDKHFEAKVESLLTGLSQSIHNDQEQAQWHTSIEVYIWITKGLLLCGHPKYSSQSVAFLTQLLIHHSDKGVRGQVAEGVRVILTEFPNVLNRKCGASCNMLFRQRLFELVGPNLLAFISKHSEETTEALTGFCYIVAFSPKAAFISLISTIMPLVLRGLSSDHVELGAAAIKAYKIVSDTSIEHVKPFLKDVFHGLLQQAQHSANALDRKDALECIGMLTTLPYELIHSYKDRVLRQLLFCLDDRKRFVRYTAVRVRNKWSVL
uniref:MMS19 nucleotide excision repair protein n=1 Tax=Albugo laibachii Nc14 TaxID=890382 RepID=F0W529_9STRA|nr:MMS19 nucleotide excision repair protein putative [Albugo laibachii Nc14]|eukprot:CCA16220.1 MMS19 nucleotide excision repair protein putative [Albugo laibachii Nc14]